MDIYDYFNSNDVAEHCRKLGRVFNAFESAVIINQCYTKTFEEKLAVYRAIIDEYLDMEVPKTWMNENHIPSFHEALGRIIEYEERKLAKFLESESCAVYQTRLNHKGSVRYDYSDVLFSTYEESRSFALEEIKSSEELRDCWDRGDVMHVDIRKNYIGSDNFFIRARLTLSGDIINMDGYIFPNDTENPVNILDCYIDVPVPFKKGDLVEIDEDGGFMGNLFVLQNLSCESPHHEKWIMQADTSDMTAKVYYLEEGQVNCEHIHFYPNLRYCRRELEGDERILKFVGLFVQDKICLCELLGVQKFLLADKLRNKEAKNPAITWGGNLDEDSMRLLLK